MAAIRTQREIRQRAPWWFAGLLLLNIGVMSYDARDRSNRLVVGGWAQTLAYPVQRVVGSAVGQATGFFGGLGEMRSATAENQQLRQQVGLMEAELREIRAKAAEADRLRGLLGLKQQNSYTVVPARVIARDPSVWFDAVTIDKGRQSGIENNMPVVTSTGIVGRIVSTGPLSAQVMLLSDERSGAGAVVGQSRAFGSIKGMGDNGLLELRYVSGLEKVEVGDAVVTTGQDGIYPAGLPIGEVAAIKTGSATENHLIYVKPSAGIDRLEEVAVLLYHPPQHSETDDSLPNVEKKTRSRR